MEYKSSAFSLSEKVLIQGDVHGNMKAIIGGVEAAVNSGIKDIIQLGDFWFYSPEEIELLEKVLEKTGCNYHFIAGNHEDWPILDSFGTLNPVSISNNITYLPTGSVFNVGEKRCVVAGGAVSIDKRYRSEGYTWFPREEMSLREFHEVESAGSVDILFSHDCPSRVNIDKLLPRINTMGLEGVLSESRKYREIIDELVDICRPSYVFHGHYHIYNENVSKYDDGKELRTYSVNMEFNKNSLAVLNSKNGSVEMLSNMIPRKIRKRYL